MSMSTAADMVPGSRLPTSSTNGKLSVWSEASCSEPPPPPPPPHAATIETVPSATARERNTANRVIPPPTEHGSRRAHQGKPPFLDIHRPLPGGSGARVRRRRTNATPDSGEAPLLHAQFWALAGRSQAALTTSARRGG